MREEVQGEIVEVASIDQPCEEIIRLLNKRGLSSGKFGNSTPKASGASVVVNSDAAKI
ncbi:hypothetical protein FRC11_003051 [Ceratobasidium sp. 423]|nr:hypothetical protein FRC11_003051 [Ceratobasidium sp. 423]